MVAPVPLVGNDRLPSLQKRWESIVRTLRRPDFELTAEEFAPILATFKELARLGEAFDPALAALMRILEAQMVGGSEDGDEDAADFFLEPDELHEVGSWQREG